MPLMNYTTSIAPARTISQISTALAKVKARQITTTYDDGGSATGISFAVETPYGLRNFVLPVNVHRVFQTLQRQRVERRYQTYDQAERVAWRIVKDWLEAQVAIIETEMVSLDQVMLSYMAADDGRTVYEAFVNTQLAIGASEQ